MEFDIIIALSSEDLANNIILRQYSRENASYAKFIPKRFILQLHDDDKVSILAKRIERKFVLKSYKIHKLVLNIFLKCAHTKP